MRLTIITINYNSSENTIKLLESLKNQTLSTGSGQADFEVIVVDNNSGDVEKLMNYQTSTEFLNRLKHGQETTSSETNIIYIKNNRNLGYSGGNNIGIKRALQNGANWMLLLNNDTMPESHFIEHLRADLEGKEEIIGLALDEGNGVAYAGKVEWLKPTLIHIPTSQVGYPQAYAIGGAMLIHKSIFDRIGLLDENYFLYFEDVDFCQRARKAGIPVSFIPEIIISHSVSASTKKLGSPMLLRYHYRNALYFNLKNGSWYIKLLVWPWSWMIIVKQIIKIVVGKNKEQSLAILKGVGDFYRKRYGKIPNS